MRILLILSFLFNFVCGDLICQETNLNTPSNFISKLGRKKLEKYIKRFTIVSFRQDANGKIIAKNLNGNKYEFRERYIDEYGIGKEVSLRELQRDFRSNLRKGFVVEIDRENRFYLRKPGRLPGGGRILRSLQFIGRRIRNRWEIFSNFLWLNEPDHSVESSLSGFDLNTFLGLGSYEYQDLEMFVPEEHDLLKYWNVPRRNLDIEVNPDFLDELERTLKMQATFTGHLAGKLGLRETYIRMIETAFTTRLAIEFIELMTPRLIRQVAREGSHVIVKAVEEILHHSIDPKDVLKYMALTGVAVVVLNCAYAYYFIKNIDLIRPTVSIAGLREDLREEIVIEYVVRHGSEYDQVLWFNAESVETLTHHFRELAYFFGIYDEYDSYHETISKVIMILNIKYKKLLVVYDDVPIGLGVRDLLREIKYRLNAQAIIISDEEVSKHAIHTHKGIRIIEEKTKFLQRLIDSVRFRREEHMLSDMLYDLENLNLKKSKDLQILQNKLEITAEKLGVTVAELLHMDMFSKIREKIINERMSSPLFDTVVKQNGIKLIELPNGSLLQYYYFGDKLIKVDFIRKFILPLNLIKVLDENGVALTKDKRVLLSENTLKYLKHVFIPASKYLGVADFSTILNFQLKAQRDMFLAA